jgi:Phosphotransferase system, mannose/fructose-specific component IIA
MTVGLLLITHNRVGEELLATAHSTLGVQPLPARCLAIPQDVDLDRLTAEAKRLFIELDQGDGVLVLTDAYGSTPSNIATQLAQRHNAAVVAGVNLPMLLRVLNYPHLSLRELEDKALSGGQDGVLLVRDQDHPVDEE